MVSFKENINVVFRLNFGVNVGLGHLYRCLKIAKSLKNKKKIVFVFDRNVNLKLINLILKGYKIIFLYKDSEKFKNQLTDALKFNEITKNFNQKFTIVDDYRLSDIWHKKVKNVNNKIIVIDDLLNRKMFCDFYINYKYENFNKKRIKKYLPKTCVKLLGPVYNTLDNNLYKNHKKEYVMVNFGNSFDFKNFKIHLDKIVNICLETKTKLIICVGIFSKNFEFLEKVAKYKLVKVLFKKFQIEHYLNKTKVFIGSAGSSIYEMSYLNTPSIFLKIVKNQTNNQSDLDNWGKFFYFEKINNKKYFFELLKVLIKHNSRIRKIKNKNSIKKNGVKKIIREINLK